MFNYCTTNYTQGAWQAKNWKKFHWYLKYFSLVGICFILSTFVNSWTVFDVLMMIHHTFNVTWYSFRKLCYIQNNILLHCVTAGLPRIFRKYFYFRTIYSNRDRDKENFQKKNKKLLDRFHFQHFNPIF